VQFGVLGDLVVIGDDGGPVAVGGPRQRDLLVLLLLSANRTVAADLLTEELWPRHAGDVSAQALKMAVSRLRRALSPGDGGHAGEASERIATREHGYRLRVEAGELDAVEFEREVTAGRAALDRGDAALAVARFRTALARWRGPALDEFRDHEWARLDALRLEELRVEALEERIDAELVLGHHRAVVAELEQLVGAHPERERLREHLMIALYRSGRQVEALTAFQDARRHLIDEYGVEPGERLRGVHQAILNQDPELAAGDQTAPSGASPPATARPPDPRPRLNPRLRVQSEVAFVGRAPEREVLESAVDQPDGPVRTILISGEPGIGKTRLVSEFATRAHESGVAVCGGRCDSRLGLPYQPFVEVLDDILAWAPSGVIEQHLEVHGLVLARIAPRLALGQSAAQSKRVQDGEGAHYRLFVAVADLLAQIARDAPLVMVLEDLHWADEPTVRLLQHVITLPQPGLLTTVGTFRSTDLDDTPLAGLLPELHREPTVRRISLDGLSDTEVMKLVQAQAPDQLGRSRLRVVRRLRRDTAGNPFFLIQLLQAGALASAPVHGRRAADDAQKPLPTSLRETIMARVADLGARASEILCAAAVVGDEFDLALLRELELASEDELLATVEAAVTARLILEASEPAARLVFVHALVPHVLRAELSAARRRALHRQIAEAMERLYGSDGGDRVAVLAHHWRAGCEPPAMEPAVRTARLAAERARDSLAPAEAVRWYQDALALHGQLGRPDEAARCDLLIGLGESQREAGDPAFRETLLEAARLAEDRGDRDQIVRATLANTRGFTSATGEIDTERVEMLRAALAATDSADSAERARLLAAEAVELAFCGERHTPGTLSSEALAMARRSGDDAALAQVLTMRFFAIWTPDTLSARLTESSENVALCEGLGDPLALAQALHWRANACMEASDVAAARRCMERAAQLSDRLREPTVMWQAAYNDANLALTVGQLERAEQLSLAALDLGQRSGQPDAVPVFAAQLANLRFEQGRLGELIPLIKQVLTEHAGITGFRALLALAHCEQQDWDAVSRALAQDQETGFAQLAYDVTWLSVVCIYAHVCARLAELGAAARLYSMLEPWRDQVAMSVVGWGCVSHYLGMLAAALHDFPAAGEHLDHAGRVHKLMGAPVWSARTQLETARCLAIRRGRGDHGRSRSLAEQALASAQELGCATIARDATAVLEGVLTPK
jgi:DNA-binding SARP family transcriptional activator/predicted ATPase